MSLIKSGQITCSLELGATHGGFHLACDLLHSIDRHLGSTRPKPLMKWQTVWVHNLVGQDYEISFTSGHERKISVSKALKGREMAFPQWEQLFDLHQKLGYGFISTPDTPQTAKFLADMGASGIKVMAGDMDHERMVRACAGLGLPVLLDARATIGEIALALEWVRAEGAPEVICVHDPPGYPALPSMVNLGAITRLQECFGKDLIVGFSDHSPGWGVCVGAVALGARYIEKVVTQDRAIPEPEHIMGLEPAQVPEFVQGMVDALSMMGDALPAPNPVNRRGIVARGDISKGDTFLWESFLFRRPQTAGLSPERAEGMVGKRATRDIGQGEFIQEGDAE